MFYDVMQVQPAVVVANGNGDVLYSWTWHNLSGDLEWGGEKHSQTVFLRPTPESLLEAMKTSDFSDIAIANYPREWPRRDFPYSERLSQTKL